MGGAPTSAEIRRSVPILKNRYDQHIEEAVDTWLMINPSSIVYHFNQILNDTLKTDVRMSEELRYRIH
jgi:hypothetical protein